MKRLSILFIALLVGITPAFSQKRELGKVKTIVIDPGHGGDKPGAIGKNCKEKDLVLQIALKFGKLITDNYSDVSVIYTHSTDKDVSLAERAHIANRNKADLFISIHANSHPTPTPTGVETFVMGLSQSRANMEVAKTENADILLEADYKDNSAYQGFDPNSPESYVMFAMYQNAYLNKSLDFAKMIQDQYKSHLRTIDRGVKQAELFVIYKTTMPAVLTEVGFISNPAEEAFMMSDEGQAKIALSLFNAFANYKAGVENTKVPTAKVIDLPGYGKNAPSKNQVAERKRIADSIEHARMDNAVASLLQQTGSVSANDTTASQTVATPSTPKSVAEKSAVQKPITEKPVAPKPVAAAANNKTFTPNSSTVPVSEGRAETAPATQVPATPSTGNLTELPAPKANPNDVSVDALEFRVQFLVSDKELKEGDKALKGVTGYKSYQMDGTYRYTMGGEPTINRALSIQTQIRKKGFKDAFIIAFYKGKRISLQEARAMQK